MKGFEKTPEALSPGGILMMSQAGDKETNFGWLWIGNGSEFVTFL